MDRSSSVAGAMATKGGLSLVALFVTILPWLRVESHPQRIWFGVHW